MCCLARQPNKTKSRRSRKGTEVIYGKDIPDYNQALVQANLDSLETRRKELCLHFAKKCVKSKKSQNMFPLRVKEHSMEVRDQEKYFVQHAKTDRLKNSTIPYMQRLLNMNEENDVNQKSKLRIRMPGY